MHTLRCSHLLVLVSAATALSCAKPAPPSANKKAAQAHVQQKQRFVLDAYGVSGLLPKSWTLRKSTAGFRASCGKSDETSDCVVLIQAQAMPSDGRAISPVLQVKNQLLDELKAVDPEGKLLRTAVYDHNGVSGLRMEMRFGHQDQIWRKDMLLIQRNRSVVMLSLAASDEAFVTALPSWKAMFESLQFLPVKKN